MSTTVAPTASSPSRARRPIRLVVRGGRDRVATLARHAAYRLAVARGRLGRAARLRDRLNAGDGTPSWQDAEWQ